ncbi:TPA: hypothetical protein MND73_004297 [Salmonella enterica subsp. houtenae]|nr:hypothetical protein [Salmonella enterica subsp. houtenae]
MGKGGGSNEVPETSQQRAQADIAMRQWKLYSNELKPMENIFMDKVDKLNDGSKYDQLAAMTNLGYQKNFGEAREQAAGQLASAGIDPSSGKYQGALNALSSDQSVGQSDTTNRAQTSQADKYVAGLQDVVSLGTGQKTGALQGYNNLAENSLRKATADAESAYTRRQGNASLVGAGLGAVGGDALHRFNKPATATSTSTPGAGANGLQNYASGMKF